MPHGSGVALPLDVELLNIDNPTRMRAAARLERIDVRLRDPVLSGQLRCRHSAFAFSLQHFPERGQFLTRTTDAAICARLGDLFSRWGSIGLVDKALRERDHLLELR